MNMRKVHIPNVGSNVAVVTKAFAVGITECQAAQCGLLTIITRAKDKLDTKMVGEVLGEAKAQQLEKGDSVSIGISGIAIRQERVGTVQKTTTPRIGLVFYASKKNIQKLDDLNFKCLIYVSRRQTDGKESIAETVDITIQGAKINLSKAVVELLENLTATVNLSTGLGHPSDLEHAKRQFASLQEQNIYWDPFEIEKWAIKNGWRVSDAKKLSALSARYA